MRVAIGIPSGDMVHTDFAICLSRLVGFQILRNTEIAVTNGKSSLVQRGRNMIVAEAKKIQASHILFVDTDMVFQPALLKDLLARNKDIVGADYMKRRPPFKATARDLDGNEFGYDEKGLKEAKCLPGGAMLVDMKVFEAITMPYFDTKWDDAIGDFVGEDYFFCEKARAAGFKIFCDLDVKVGHIGEAIYTRSMFERIEKK